ncbi:MAG: FAD-dependent oxidoreductase [Peptostreptococcaceae bacterium]|jgi:nitrite reductase (NADH) large subunit|nr:FAD-dependent oxidoreductase [Peptostreptococcaceae bacterium]
MHTNYLIIGNGIAGLSAIKEIRKNNNNSKITLISKESYPTYYRVKLSHFISKQFDNNELFIHDKSWYDENNIDLILDDEVLNIDFDNKNAYLKNNQIINYDKLILANGSSPFIPKIDGYDKENIFSLRTLKDLLLIQNKLKNSKEVIIVGGGVLGLEAAYEISKNENINVKVIEFYPYLLPRQLDFEMSKEFEKILKKPNLEFCLDSKLKKINGDKKISSITLEDGKTIKSDFLLFSTGVRANLKLFENSILNYDKGIQVDKYMKTNINDVYACGDVIEFEGRMFGTWSEAQNQGKTAGKNASDVKTIYVPSPPQNILNVGKNSLFSAGNVEKFDDHVFYKENEKIYKLYLNNKKITGAVVINDNSKMLKLKTAVQKNTNIEIFLDENKNLIDILSLI